MTGPLEGITVLDLTWVLSGPYGAMVLCDLGAEVIKVERPPHGDLARTTGPHINGVSGYFMSINRGKKSISIDLANEEGKELFLKLVEQADVVVENFTPGTMDRLGLGYEDLRKRNKRIIYAATSGFGQTGPDKDRPALDVVVQGMGGVMSITGHPGGPPTRPGLSLGDIAAGLFTAIGVLSALHERERSDEGQMIDVSMLDCQIAILENAFMRYFATGIVPGPIGTRHPLATPFQAFPTRDGYLVLALWGGAENQWEMLCALLGTPELIYDERFATNDARTGNHAELEPILNEAMKKRSTEEWLQEFDAIGIPCGPLNTIPEAAEHRQVRAREMLIEVEHPVAGKLRLSNTPVKLSRTPGGIKGRSPSIWQHTDEVLRELLNVSEEDLERLHEAEVIL